MLEESREASMHLRKLDRVMETVADHRLKELQYFQSREQLATWRRTHGYDRDDSCMPGTLHLSPQEFTASLRSDLQELKDAISMSGRTRPWQKTRKFLDGLKGNLPDEELAAIKRYVERRSREASQVTVTPVSTAQHCILRSLNLEIPSDVYVSMEEKDEGRMNPGPTELESPPAGTMRNHSESTPVIDEEHNSYELYFFLIWKFLQPSVQKRRCCRGVLIRGRTSRLPGHKEARFLAEGWF